jgi:hypothetical protein
MDHVVDFDKNLFGPNLECSLNARLVEILHLLPMLFGCVSNQTAATFPSFTREV